MKKEQYEKIVRFKPQFELAKSNFARVSRGDLNIIMGVYNEEFGANYNQGNLNCNKCVIKMLKEMGQAVKNYEDWYEKRYGKPGADSDNDGQK